MRSRKYACRTRLGFSSARRNVSTRLTCGSRSRLAREQRSTLIANRYCIKDSIDRRDYSTPASVPFQIKSTRFDQPSYNVLYDERTNGEITRDVCRRLNTRREIRRRNTKSSIEKRRRLKRGRSDCGKLLKSCVSISGDDRGSWQTTRKKMNREMMEGSNDDGIVVSNWGRIFGILGLKWRCFFTFFGRPKFIDRESSLIDGSRDRDRKSNGNLP